MYTYPVSVTKTLLRKGRPLGQLAVQRTKIRGWRAVSAAGLLGKGSLKRSVIFSDTGMMRRFAWENGSRLMSFEFAVFIEEDSSKMEIIC